MPTSSTLLVTSTNNVGPGGTSTRLVEVFKACAIKRRQEPSCQGYLKHVVNLHINPIDWHGWQPCHNGGHQQERVHQRAPVQSDVVCVKPLKPLQGAFRLNRVVAGLQHADNYCEGGGGGLLCQQQPKRFRWWAPPCMCPGEAVMGMWPDIGIECG